MSKFKVGDRITYRGITDDGFIRQVLAVVAYKDTEFVVFSSSSGNGLITRQADVMDHWPPTIKVGDKVRLKWWNDGDPTLTVLATYSTSNGVDMVACEWPDGTPGTFLAANVVVVKEDK